MDSLQSVLILRVWFHRWDDGGVDVVMLNEGASVFVIGDFSGGTISFVLV